MAKRRPSGDGMVRKRDDGRWEGRVVISYANKGECVEKLNALKNTVTPTTAVKVRLDMPFGEWVEFWYKNYNKPMLRPSSQRSYEDFIRLYIGYISVRNWVESL